MPAFLLIVLLGAVTVSAPRAAAPPRAADPLPDAGSIRGLEELRLEKAALDPAGAKLESRLRAPARRRIGRALQAGLASEPSWRRHGGLRVLVRVARLDDVVRHTLRAAGLFIERERPGRHLLEGWVPEARLRALAEVDAVRTVQPADRGQARAGPVGSRGDGAARADLARAVAGVDGRGVRIGVISDGIDGLAISQSQGELPAVSVPAGCDAGAGSEGRAMLEIVHDLAPGAELLFANGIDSALTFTQAVECLAAAGADVIVDDLGFFGEPYFEDGALAESVRDAVRAGVSYHSAAGNSALVHYQDRFRPSPRSKLHDFGGDGGVDNVNSVIIPPGGSILCVLQWDNPFGAAADDYDLLLVDDAREVITASDTVQNGDDDPIEVLVARNDGRGTEVAGLVIERDRGDERTLELYCVRDVDGLEHATAGSSIFGHAGVPEAVTVGAIDADDPGLDTVERFSSQGPAEIAFPPERRPKPDVAGFDGVDTGVPGFRPFFGTSAAAPHVAAVAALLLQRNPHLLPGEIQATLTATAVDIGAAGFDALAGAGRVDALAAVNATAPPECASDPECADTDACTLERCERGRCVRPQTSCDDGDPCNGAESCDPASGGCRPGAQAADGTPCPDTTLCNGAESCVGGRCVAGPAAVCADADACTIDGCSAQTGCEFVPLTGVESVQCLLAAAPPCPGVRLPPSLVRRFERASVLLERSRQARARKRQRTLLRAATRMLRRAERALDGAERRLPGDCARTLFGVLGKAQDRARAVALSLR